VHDGSAPDHAASEAALESTFQLIALVYRPNNLDFFLPTLDRLRKVDPIDKHYTLPRTTVIEQGALWMGPLPPIPGENEWGDKPFDNPFDISSGDNNPQES
jgi:hypothetical protein